MPLTDAQDVTSSQTTDRSTMTAYKPGDRVRVTLEGIVTDDPEEIYFYYAGPAGPYVSSKKIISVEILKPRGPEFEDGDAIQSTAGNVAFRKDGWWQWVVDGGTWTDETTADHLETGYYRPIRIAGKAVDR